MEKFFFLFIHLGVPIIIVLLILKIKSKSKIHLIASSLLYFSIICFLYLWGQWPLVGSYYLRYLLIAILVFIVVLSAKRFRNLTAFLPKKKKNYLTILPFGLLAILFFTINIKLYTGATYTEEGVDILFPLKNGAFYIASGGSNKLVNNHMRDYPNSQQFALDINKLGSFGGAFKNIFSNRIEDHYIFSDTVYCPCSGEVKKSKTSVDDNFTSSMEVASNNGKGNYITIDCDGFFVSLYHLKKNSVIVTENSQVYEGQAIGLVGNSGFSQEPHLHIQAAKRNDNGKMVGIPMKFKNRYLSRNDLVLD